jgi:hypothetical protein
LDNPARKTIDNHAQYRVPFADILVSQVSDILSLVYNESRVMAELNEDILAFYFYRSLVWVYLAFFWNN